MTGGTPAVTCIVALSGGYWFTGFRNACRRYWNSEYHAGPIGLAVAHLNFSSATLQQAVTNAETKAGALANGLGGVKRTLLEWAGLQGRFRFLELA